MCCICWSLLVATCRYPVFVLLIGRFFMTVNHSVKDFPRSHRLVTPAGIVATGCLLLLRCPCRSDYHWRELPHVSFLSRLRQNTSFVATKTKTRLLSQQNLCRDKNDTCIITTPEICSLICIVSFTEHSFYKVWCAPIYHIMKNMF